MGIKGRTTSYCKGRASGENWLYCKVNSFLSITYARLLKIEWRVNSTSGKQSATPVWPRVPQWTLSTKSHTLFLIPMGYYACQFHLTTPGNSGQICIGFLVYNRCAYYYFSYYSKVNMDCDLSWVAVDY